ncbi:MAG: hypothetical protein ACP5N6_12675 [Anaerolineae bacterium]
MDYYLQYVVLDRNAGTTGFLFQEVRNWMRDRTSSDVAPSPFLQREICSQSDIHCLQLLLDSLPAAVPLEQGGVSFPALGGLAIRHPQNRAALEQALERIIAPLGVGPENPVEAWIISATSGDIGAGIHRFTGAFLADFIRRRYAGTPVLLNFIRIGPLAYRSLNPRQTALNAFFGVAADAAFALKLPHDFPEAAIQWFYVDFPDMGMGERGRSLRARMIEVATKVIIWEGLRESFQRLLAYNQGIPMVATRIGFWEGSLTEQRTYYEALRGLQGRLQELIEPDYEQKFIKDGVRKPQLIADGVVEWTARAGEMIIQRLKSGWRFPRFPARQYPKTLEEARALVEEWKEVVHTLLEKRWEDLEAEWAFEGAMGREFLRVAEPGDTRFGSEIWFQHVEEAHKVTAWTRYLLGCDLKTGKPVKEKEGYLEKLVTVARRLSSLLRELGLFLQPRKRFQKAKVWLGKFVQTLVAVDALLRLEAKARRFLEQELALAYQVLESTEAEFRKLESRWAQPDYEKLIANDRPLFSFSPAFSTRLGLLQSPENLESHLREGWHLRAYREFSPSLDKARDRVAGWKEDLTKLFEEEWVSGGEFVIRKTITQEEKEQEVTRPLGQWIDEEEKDWQRVENAHFVRAWAWHLLGCNLREGQPIQESGTLLEQLHHRAQTIRRLQWLAYIPIPWWLKRVSRWMSPALCEFFKTLVQVDYLLQVEKAATNVLEQELHGEPIITVRELSDAIGQSGRLTWLQTLIEEIRRADVEAFKKAVIRGVKGLEERGLRKALGLGRRASVEDLYHELSSRMGQMRINGEVVEAPSWAGVPLQASTLFERRLLPILPSNLWERLQAVATKEPSSPEYVIGFPELMPVAVEIASLAQELGDTLTAPVTLLRPFVPLVKEVLSEWDYLSPSNVPVRQLEIASAGVCGEPLYESALRAVGLNDEELGKIGQYHTYYRR